MSKTKEFSILIIEDHALTRFGLKTAFSSVGHITNVYEAEDGETGVELSKSHNPEVVIMDLGLPDINGIEATKMIKSHNPDIKILILTSHQSGIEVKAALGAGANAYCLKDIEPERLIQVVNSVADGAAWLDPGIASFILTDFASNTSTNYKSSENESEVSLDDTISLTDREQEVLKLIVDGYSNADIAKKLYVSIHTAKAHVCNILQKLAVDDRTQAAIKALKGHIV